ncbi:VTT domain-containing protein [Aquamicrobium sp. LC103]|uniref:DedA family protein n=1 Tax=Aquamicrobium sp. LC103 TaxID=1120658 RepID=UPI00069C6989|nr:VTT domain-containing protein [Aquamicrobium sp. LC103]TKT76208.1 alkaline phosphatase [Aquamicrobium sp. LC103]
MDPLATLLASAAVHGCLVLFGLAFAERMIPVLPSSALLVSMGAGAAAGAWTLQAALLASILGGMAGSVSFYWLGARVGEARLMRVLGLMLVPPALSARLKASLAANAGALAFGVQLVPTARLIAPAVAGMLAIRLPLFLLTTTAGIMLWNAAFIVLGYSTVSGFAAGTNATLIVMAALAGVGCLQMIALTMLGPRRAQGSRTAREQ